MESCNLSLFFCVWRLLHSVGFGDSPMLLHITFHCQAIPLSRIFHPWPYFHVGQIILILCITGQLAVSSVSSQWMSRAFPFPTAANKNVSNGQMSSPESKTTPGWEYWLIRPSEWWTSQRSPVFSYCEHSCSSVILPFIALMIHNLPVSNWILLRAGYSLLSKTASSRTGCCNVVPMMGKSIHLLYPRDIYGWFCFFF